MEKQKLDFRFQDETVWLTQKLMAELFQTTSQNITIHLKNIFEEGELEVKATCKDFLQVFVLDNHLTDSLLHQVHQIHHLIDFLFHVRLFKGLKQQLEGLSDNLSVQQL